MHNRPDCRDTGQSGRAPVNEDPASERSWKISPLEQGPPLQPPHPTYSWRWPSASSLPLEASPDWHPQYCLWSTHWGSRSQLQVKPRQVLYTTSWPHKLFALPSDKVANMTAWSDYSNFLYVLGADDITVIYDRSFILSSPCLLSSMTDWSRERYRWMWAAAWS